MSTNKKALGTIPEIPSSVDAGTRRVLTAMKEALDVRLGRRGDPLEEMVTKRDLVDGGLASLNKRGVLGTVDEGAGVLNPGDLGVLPTVPVAFQAVGVMGGVVLSWDLPQNAYEGHSLTEIWRSDEATPVGRAIVGTAVGSTYFDQVSSPDELTLYYWVRFVSVTGRKGPFSQMEKAIKPPDIGELIKLLSGQIDESELSAALNERLDDTETEVLEQSQIVKGLSAQYTLRLNVNGYVSGFGAYNNGITSDFAIVADRFWIASPNSVGKVKPFIVQGNSVYIDNAMIREASIQAAQIGSVSFGKIVDGSGNPITVFGGGIKAQYIQTDQVWASFADLNTAVIKSAHIRNAAIGSAHIQDLAVDTLKIAGNAVTVPAFRQAWDPTSPTWWASVLEVGIYVEQAGWLYASSSGYIGYGNGWGDTRTRLMIEGQVVSEGGGESAWTSAAHSGAVYVWPGYRVVQLQFCSPSGKGTIGSRALFVMMVKK